MTTTYDLIQESRKVIYPGVHHLWHAAVKRVLEEGEIVSPRGMKTLEVRGALFKLGNPEWNFFVNEVRKPKAKFAVAEWLWIMSGSNLLEGISRYNPQLERFSVRGRLEGAYGPMVTEQWNYVVQTLLKDPESREAVLTIWRQNARPSPDIPCTISLQFIARGGALECFANMRSNDAWLGLPYDVFVFTQLQRTMAAELGIRAGHYHHYVASLHLYEEHWEKAKAAILAPTSVDQTFPTGMTPMPPGFLPYAAAKMAGTTSSFQDPHFGGPWDFYLGLL